MSMRSMMSIHEVDIEEESVTRGAGGGQIRSWLPYAFSVSCRCRSLPPVESMQLEKEGYRVNWRVFFPDNPDLGRQHRLTYVDADNVTHYLLVKGVQNAQELDRYWAVDCLEESDVENTSA